MDKVRLGRALGYGTRHAAKTLAAVAEAAAAPDTRQPARAPETVPESNTAPATGQRSRMPDRVPSMAQVRGAGRSMWGPLATFSGALWLRVTGLFFSVIALAMANGAWKLRWILHHRSATGQAPEMRHLSVFAAFAVLFGYFAVTSFLRANLRERRAARRQAA